MLLCQLSFASDIPLINAEVENIAIKFAFLTQYCKLWFYSTCGFLLVSLICSRNKDTALCKLGYSFAKENCLH